MPRKRSFRWKDAELTREQEEAIARIARQEKRVEELEEGDSSTTIVRPLPFLEAKERYCEKNKCGEEVG